MTETTITTTTTTTIEEKYKVIAPEGMHETFMSDSEDEGGKFYLFLIFRHWVVLIFKKKKNMHVLGLPCVLWRVNDVLFSRSGLHLIQVRMRKCLVGRLMRNTCICPITRAR